MLCYVGKRYQLLTFGEFHFMHHFLCACVCMYVYLCKEEKDRGRLNGWIK